MALCIVYTSNTGYTKEYAELLAKSTGLPCYPLAEAGTALPQGAEIVYLGWLMAGSVKGYKEAAKRYRVRAVCGVGMGATGSQTEDVRKHNAIPAEAPVFTLQGGFDITRLHGAYRFMMNTMRRTAGKKLAEKPDRTPEEEAMLDMMEHGADYVSAESLEGVFEWLRGEGVPIA